jgi:hypothetical protein
VSGDDVPVTEPTPRQWWLAYEPIHAVVYFDPDCREAMDDVGLRGFWMGYFAGRAAPFGAVGPEPVIATFFNFHPTRVGRALPDAWSFASPESVWQARRTSAAATLRRVAPGVDDVAPGLLPILRAAFDGVGDAGRTLFAVTRSMGEPDDPVEALWFWCSCLREYRGDGHVSALTAVDLDGCEALVLFAASEHLSKEMLQASRGWPPEEWAEAGDRLVRRGLLHGSGITADGLGVRRAVEETTDGLMDRIMGRLPGPDRALLHRELAALSDAIAEAQVINYPNPMGLPAPTGR